MSRRIEAPADTPAEVYHYWHKRWCQILTKEYREEIVKSGLPGLSFTERVPDAPDGKGYFSYAFSSDGWRGTASVTFADDTVTADRTGLTASGEKDAQGDTHENTKGDVRSISIE